MTSPNIILTCPECGTGQLIQKTVCEIVPLRYEQSLAQVPVANLPVYVCDQCGEVIHDADTDTAIHEAACRFLKLLTPAQILAQKTRLNVTSNQIAEATGIAAESISRWLNGRVLQSRSHDKLLRLYFLDPSRFRAVSLFAESGVLTDVWVPSAPIVQHVTMLNVHSPSILDDTWTGTGVSEPPSPASTGAAIGAANSNYAMAA